MYSLLGVRGEAKLFSNNQIIEAWVVDQLFYMSAANVILKAQWLPYSGPTSKTLDQYWASIGPALYERHHTARCTLHCHVSSLGRDPLNEMPANTDTSRILNDPRSGSGMVKQDQTFWFNPLTASHDYIVFAH